MTKLDNFINTRKKGITFTAREFKYCFGMGIKELNFLVKSDRVRVKHTTPNGKAVIYEVI